MVLTNNDAYAAKNQKACQSRHGAGRRAFEPWPVRNSDGTLQDQSLPADPDSVKAPWLYQQQELGYNYRITDIQCALGTSQFSRLGEIIQRRRFLFDQYQQAFKSNPKLDLPAVPGRNRPGVSSVRTPL